VLHDAGIPPPLVNHRVANEEADLVWLDSKRIIEIDGPQYHRFAEEDARKQRAWEAAGFTVSNVEHTTTPKAPKFVQPLIVGTARCSLA